MSAAEQLVGLLCSWRPSGNVAGRSGETVLFCCCCTGPLRRRGRIIDLSFGRRTVPLVCDAAAEEQVGNVAAAALGDAAADLVGNVAAAVDLGGAAAEVCNRSDMVLGVSCFIDVKGWCCCCSVGRCC